MQFPVSCNLFLEIKGTCIMHLPHFVSVIYKGVLYKTWYLKRFKLSHTFSRHAFIYDVLLDGNLFIQLRQMSGVWESMSSKLC